MIWLSAVIAVLLICFGGVLLFGAPYLPTLKKQIGLALDLAELKPGQIMLELGSGDGRVLRAAAKKGYKAVGYELNPLLVLISKLATWRYRKSVTVKWANFLTADWPQAEVIFVFGIDRLMPKIDQKIQNYQKPVRLISFGFKITARKPAEFRGGLFVYEYCEKSR